MDSPPDSPNARAEVLQLEILSPPPTPEPHDEDQQQDQEQLTPPSTTGSLGSCIATSVSTVAPARLPVPPAWEAISSPDPTGLEQALAAAGGTGDPSDLHLTASSAAPSGERSSRASRDTASEREDTPSASPSLRLDLLPPTRDVPELSDLAAASAPAPGPSPAGPLGNGMVGPTSAPPPVERVRRRFFSEEEEQQRPEAVPSPRRVQEEPSSTRSDVSGIFELEIGSPTSSAAALARRDESVAAASSASNARQSDESVMASSESTAPGVPSSSTNDSVVSALSTSLATRMQGVWGRLAPSPDSSSPLPDRWGRMPQVMDEIREVSPQHRDAKVATTPMEQAVGQASPTSAEERKGFARFPSRSLGSTAPQSISGHASAYRPPSPSSPIPTAPATSPPTPAASAGNTPADASALRSPSTLPEPMVEPSSRASPSEAHEAHAQRSPPLSATIRPAPGSPSMRPGGALGAASPVPFTAERTDSVEGRFNERNESLPDEGREIGHRGGEGDAGMPEGPGGLTLGGRGYVGQRFFRAAEVLSESPRLRRAADAAATVVLAAADTARVRFTVTSRSIGNMLAASAKSFEEFVEEQLRQDGSGQDHDIGFALRRRYQAMGGSTEEDVFELERYRSGQTFQGRWTNEGNRTAALVMVWDNSYSCIRPKTLAYNAQVLRPGIDPTAPPPPPPPTPAMGTASPARTRSTVAVGRGRSGGFGGGGLARAADTEGVALEESELGEETHSSSAEAGRVVAGSRTREGGLALTSSDPTGSEAIDRDAVRDVKQELDQQAEKNEQDILPETINLEEGPSAAEEPKKQGGV